MLGSADEQAVGLVEKASVKESSLSMEGKLERSLTEGTLGENRGARTNQWCPLLVESLRWLCRVGRRRHCRRIHNVAGAYR